MEIACRFSNYESLVRSAIGRKFRSKQIIRTDVVMINWVLLENGFNLGINASVVMKCDLLLIEVYHLIIINAQCL